jgi:hypothetical protein
LFSSAFLSPVSELLHAVFFLFPHEGTSMFYSSQGWDPVLIVTQIVSIQSIFYLSTGLALHLFSIGTGYPISIGQFFSSSELGFTNTRALCTTLSFFLSGVLWYERTVLFPIGVVF